MGLERVACQNYWINWQDYVEAGLSDIFNEVKGTFFERLPDLEYLIGMLWYYLMKDAILNDYLDYDNARKEVSLKVPLNFAINDYVDYFLKNNDQRLIDETPPFF